MAGEIAHHGWGDERYGSMPQNSKIVALLARYRAMCGEP